jgi:divalent metal cation (Fe/Co/Zn/Cd) transporter
VTDARLFRLLRLSIGAAVATITLKVLAWSLTGSVGLLSDAAESVVNLVAAIVALLALRSAATASSGARPLLPAIGGSQRFLRWFQ